MIAHRKVIVLVFLILSWGVLPFKYVEAHTLNDTFSAKNTHHVIFCFDQRVGGFNKYLNQDLSVKHWLMKMVSKNDSLLKMGDFYSILTYEEGNLDCTLKNFAQPAIRNSKELIWQTYRGAEDMFSGNWAILANGHATVDGQPYSLQTAAKSYCLTRTQNDEHYANRTFLIMITDDAYNGNDDFNKEFYSMFNVSGEHMSDRERFNSLEAIFISKCRKVASYYRFDYIPEYEHIFDTNWTDEGVLEYKVMAFEVSPSSTFSLASVVDYPANLGLTRVRGGYLLDFSYYSSDSIYHINKFNVSIKNRLGDIKEKYNGGEGSNHVCVKLHSSELNSDFVEVIIAGWLRQMDGLYNGLEMNPLSPDNNRLMARLYIPLKTETKILGIVPLYDCMWWWYPNDLTTAVRVWDIIIIVISIILICIIAYQIFNRITCYIPDNKKIKINRIDGYCH